MVNYLEYFPPFGNNQGLLEYEIIGLVEFYLPCKWQKQLLVQGYKSSSKYLYELMEFCECLETAKEIY